MIKNMARRFLFGLLLAIGVASCAEEELQPAPPLPVPAAPQEQNVKKAVEIIDGVPPWSAKEYKAADLDALLAAARQVAGLPLDDVRKAVAHLCDPGRSPQGSLESASRVFVILRATFQVPAIIEVAKAKSFGGWVRPDAAPGKYLLLWPLKDQDGRIVGVENFRGYFGASYDGASEFDFFRSQFAIRKF